jgi:hypothetical protein
MLSMCLVTSTPSATEMSLRAKDNAKTLPTYLEMAQTEQTMELDLEEQSSFDLNLQQVEEGKFEDDFGADLEKTPLSSDP